MHAVESFWRIDLSTRNWSSYSIFESIIVATLIEMIIDVLVDVRCNMYECLLYHFMILPIL